MADEKLYTQVSHNSKSNYVSPSLQHIRSEMEIYMDIDYKLIGNRIQNQRKKCGYTQESFSELMDVTPGYISQVERGITHVNLDTLARMANYLECDIACFITNSNNKNSDYMMDDINDICKKLSNSERNILYQLLKEYLNIKK